MSATATLPAQTEKAFMAQVTELAKTLGWNCYHPWLSMRSERGWPDLSLCRERLVFAELKTDLKSSQMTANQLRWQANLEAAGAEFYCWRPRDWDHIVAVLSAHGAIPLRTKGEPK